MGTDIVWRPIAGHGYEHLQIREEDDHILIDSIVLGVEEHNIYRIKYDITLDKSWATRKITIGHLGTNQTLYLESDGNGVWRNRQGEEVTELSGSIDIDISCTPFTNTLPIKRLSYEPFEQKEISVVYISAFDLAYKQVRQKYTLLESHTGSAIFQYQSGNFVENITVDSAGIVTVYPHLFVKETP